MEETKYISFLIKNDELLEKYNEIWNKVSKVIKKEFDSEPVYNNKYLKAKIKSYEEKINTNFHNNNVPKEGSQYICLSVILIDSQVFIEECKYVTREKEMPKYITENIEIYSQILLKKGRKASKENKERNWKKELQKGLQKEAHERYQNLSDEEKNKKASMHS